MSEREEAVGIDDRAIVEGNVGRPGGLCPHRDHDDMGPMFRRCACLLNEEPVGIEEAGLSVDEIDMVAGHLLPHDLDFVFDDVVRAKREVFDRDRLFQTIACSVEGALAEP